MASIFHSENGFDVVMVNSYDVPLLAANGQIRPLDDLSAAWNVDDILPVIRTQFTFDNEIYAAPFRGETTIVYFRKDILEKHGLSMPNEPTWEFVAQAARKMTNRDKEVYGICLPGKAGWFRKHAVLDIHCECLWARMFDETWDPSFDDDAWSDMLGFYIELLNTAGPPSPWSNGF